MISPAYTRAYPVYVNASTKFLKYFYHSEYETNEYIFVIIIIIPFAHAHELCMESQKWRENKWNNGKKKKKKK